MIWTLGDYLDDLYCIFCKCSYSICIFYEISGRHIHIYVVSVLLFWKLYLWVVKMLQASHWKRIIVFMFVPSHLLFIRRSVTCPQMDPIIHYRKLHAVADCIGNTPMTADILDIPAFSFQLSPLVFLSTVAGKRWVGLQCLRISRHLLTEHYNAWVELYFAPLSPRLHSPLKKGGPIQP